jgi:hypothetical protein
LLASALVLAGQASPVQWLVTLTLMVTLAQRRCGPGGVGASCMVLAEVVVGEDGDFMDTPGGKVWAFLRR